MKDILREYVEELKKLSPLTTHVAAASTGAVVVAAVYYHMIGKGRTITLGQDAFDALVNDETNFIRFTSPKHNHIFRVTLEQ